MAELDAGALGHDDHPGDPSAFACPDCGGVLWEIDDEGRIRFRCRTGHAYTSRALMAAQDETLEEALWSALRALEEQSSLARRLADRSKAFGAEWTQRRLQRRADEAVDRAAVLRRFLMTEPSPSEPAEVTPDEAPDLLEERVDARAADRGA